MASSVNSQAFQVKKLEIKKKLINHNEGPFNAFSKLGTTVGVVEEKKLDQHFERNPKILYITAASAYNTKDLNGTMEVISEMFRERKNADKDNWLFGIDISVTEKETQNM